MTEGRRDGGRPDGGRDERTDGRAEGRRTAGGRPDGRRDGRTMDGWIDRSVNPLIDVQCPYFVVSAVRVGSQTYSPGLVLMLRFEFQSLSARTFFSSESVLPSFSKNWVSPPYSNSFNNGLLKVYYDRTVLRLMDCYCTGIDQKYWASNTGPKNVGIPHDWNADLAPQNTNGSTWSPLRPISGARLRPTRGPS